MNLIALVSWKIKMERKRTMKKLFKDRMDKTLDLDAWAGRERGNSKIIPRCPALCGGGSQHKMATERGEMDGTRKNAVLNMFSFEVNKWNKDWKLRRRPDLGDWFGSYWLNSVDWNCGGAWNSPEKVANVQPLLRQNPGQHQCFLGDFWEGAA